jgi:hypothetical protein
MFVMQGIFNLSNVIGKIGCSFNQITVKFSTDSDVQFAKAEAHFRSALSVAQYRRRDYTLYALPFFFIAHYCKL